MFKPNPVYHATWKLGFYGSPDYVRIPFLVFDNHLYYIHILFECVSRHFNNIKIYPVPCYLAGTPVMQHKKYNFVLGCTPNVRGIHTTDIIHDR